MIHLESDDFLAGPVSGPVSPFGSQHVNVSHAEIWKRALLSYFFIILTEKELEIVPPSQI